MFQRRDHDRAPRHDHYWRETPDHWRVEGFVGDRAAALDLLDGDFQQLAAFYASPYRGERKILAEDARTFELRDEWGATTRQWKDRSGTPEHLCFECDDAEYWRRRVKPAILAAGPAVDLDAVRLHYCLAQQKKRWCYLTSYGFFEFSRHLMGDEVTLIAFAVEPDWLVDVAETIAELVIRDLQHVLDAGIVFDGVLICDDMAFNHGTLCAPAAYRALIRPSHQRVADWAHQHGLGMIFHTDGNVNAVIGDYIAAGFDCLTPLEAKAGMDVRDLCPRYGDRLAFMGNIDMRLAAGGDRDAIEHDLRTKLEAGMASRCYAYHSDHSVPPNLSLATYRFIVELLDRYGQYESAPFVSGTGKGVVQCPSA